MKRITAALSLLLASVAAQATAVWSIDIENQFGSDPAFSLVGTFTTASAAIDRGVGAPVLSFEATLNGAPTQLVLLGADLAFLYDNRFFGPTDLAAGWSTLDAFDNAGLVLTTPCDSLNVYSDGLLIGLYASGVSEALEGTISFAGLTSTVPEPGALVLYSLGLLLLQIRLRR